MRKYIIIIITSISLTNCSEFLDVKPDLKLAIPDKLEDLEALLNNTAIFNIRNFGIGEASSDNVFITSTIWNSLPIEEKEIYIWGDNVIPQSNIGNNPWADAYQTIFYTNSILEVLEEKFANDKSQRRNEIKGKALFLRAFYYLFLTTTWAPVFDEVDADLPKGVPLRLSSNFNIKSKRATVRDCYEQIERDLLNAIDLLPRNVEFAWIPNMAAGYALLSRMYMSMRKYDRAGEYALKALEFRGDLMDFNELNENERYSIPRLNKEIFFNSGGNNVVYVTFYYVIMDDVYKLFDSLDLRKKHFFLQRSDGTQYFRGSYGEADVFTGLTTSEMYLNRSESLIRAGQISDGMEILNKLLISRWKDGEFIPLVISDQQQALQIVLDERRKELLFRDLRWSDLKRLNKEAGFEKKVIREVNDVPYELLPNSDRYNMPLPERVNTLID